MPHRIAVLALPDVVAFDLATPFQLLHRHYELTLCGVEAGEIPTTSGFPVVAQRGIAALAKADTIIVPGFDPRAHGWPPPAEALHALRDAHARGARIVSICTGAFALGAAGLLDGRCVTTHWR